MLGFRGFRAEGGAVGVIKEVVTGKKTKASKKKGEKGAFSKMIDFFAED